MKIGASKHHCVRLVRLSWLPVALLIGAALTLLGPIPAPGQQTAVQNLTLAQIEELVTHGVPDSTMSTQIERRGISFIPTPAILDSLRGKGAGPLTLAAISRAHQPTAPSHETGSSATRARRGPKLTQAQLQHLIRIRASDAFIAKQIQSRGVSFLATEAEVSSFGTIGAGPRTLTELRGLVQTGSVQIHTEPGAAVTLDGKAASQADSAGLLSLQDVLPGEHTLMLNKDGFHPAQQSFTLGDREARQLSAPLAWAGGLLTVSAQPASAAVSVTGPASFSEAVNAVRCPPGAYTVTVSLSGYVSQTHTFTIAADQNQQERFQLIVDPVALAKTLADAQGRLTGGDAQAAIRLSSHALTLDPTSAQAYKILAEASFSNGDFQTSIHDGSRAVHRGQPITIRLMHVHNFPRHFVHPVDITVSDSGITFSSVPGVKCKIPESLNYDLIPEPSVFNDPSGTAMLRINWFDHPHGFGVLHELDFVPQGSGMVRAPSPPGVIVHFAASVLQTPENTRVQYQAILDLIAQARR